MFSIFVQGNRLNGDQNFISQRKFLNSYKTNVKACFSLCLLSKKFLAMVFPYSWGPLAVITR